MSDDHSGHHVKYIYIFFALCGFTVLSILTDLGRDQMGHMLLIVLVFAVATAKALCVMAYFMHLKFEGNWKWLLLAPTTVLAIGVPLAMAPDVSLHYYRVDVPQNPVQAEADDGETHDEHAAH